MTDALHTAPNDRWDLVIVGGGAAGFFAAIRAAEIGGNGQKILILEQSSRVLGKVRISGGGRCNVTHSCFDPREFATHFPRGEKELIGALHRWAADDTIDWFESHSVPLKTESDGRIFPVSDQSQSVIDCLVRRAEELNVKVLAKCSAHSIQSGHDGNLPEFSLRCTHNGSETRFKASRVILATGGTRAAAGESMAKELGHTTLPPVPSLFTFEIPNDPRLEDLQGISVENVELSIPVHKLDSDGPLLVTHWGLSGPAVLRLSAWGARTLHSVGYEFELQVNWLPGIDVKAHLDSLRIDWSKRSIFKRSPFEAIPRRLWGRLAAASHISEGTTWGQLSQADAGKLNDQLVSSLFHVCGKSLNKDEFVTCGGVPTKEVNFRTMESRLAPGLYFAGEILNIDGITGGFNFQNAWTTGFIAGTAVGESLLASA